MAVSDLGDPIWRRRFFASLHLPAVIEDMNPRIRGGGKHEFWCNSEAAYSLLVVQASGVTTQQDPVTKNFRLRKTSVGA
jgi:hypothetical protein